MTSDDITIVIESLASCAIEGNKVAIELLELRKKDYKAFLIELYNRGLVSEGLRK